MTTHPNSRRERAEALLQRDANAMPVVPTADVQKLVHELQVHEIELQMQNEELRHSQLELAASRDAYAELYDFAPVGYLTLDRAGRILEANLTAAALLGVERGRLCSGRRFSDFVARDAQDAWSLSWRRQLDGGPLHDCELALIRPDGRALYARLTIAVVDRPSTDMWQCMLTLTDVTERRAADDALRAGQVQLAAIIDAALDAILVLDETRHILHFNPAAEKMFGCVVAEVLGEEATRFIPDLPCEAQADVGSGPTLAGAASDPGVSLSERVGRRCDGTEFSIEGTLSQFKLGGRQVYTAIVRDITQRKRNEEQIRQHVQNLEALNEELQRFNRAAVGREVRMVELKKEVNALCVANGQPPRYAMALERGAP